MWKQWANTRHEKIKAEKYLLLNDKMKTNIMVIKLRNKELKLEG
jgi:hypothetical protein